MYSRGVQLGRGNSHELVYFTALAARAEACPITMHAAREAYVRAGMFSTYTLSKKPITLGKSKQKTKQKETIKKKKDKVDDICWSCDKAVCELLAAPHASPGRSPLPPLRVPSSLTSLREHYTLWRAIYGASVDLNVEGHIRHRRLKAIQAGLSTALRHKQGGWTPTSPAPAIKTLHVIHGSGGNSNYVPKGEQHRAASQPVTT